MNFRRLVPIAALLCLGGCMTVTNDPINELAVSQTNLVEALPESADSEDTTVIGLGFSGGGTRAAAFSYGLLRELEATPMPGDPQGRSMHDAVRFI